MNMIEGSPEPWQKVKGKQYKAIQTIACIQSKPIINELIFNIILLKASFQILLCTYAMTSFYFKPAFWNRNITNIRWYKHIKDLDESWLVYLNILFMFTGYMLTY